MHQFFLQWILDAEKLVRRFPKAPWADLASGAFWTHHADVYKASPEEYKRLFDEAFVEVERRLNVHMVDYKDLPF